MLPIHTVTNAHCYLCTVNLYKMLLCKSVLYIMLLIPCGPIRIALLGTRDYTVQSEKLFNLFYRLLSWLDVRYPLLVSTEINVCLGLKGLKPPSYDIFIDSLKRIIKKINDCFMISADIQTWFRPSYFFIVYIKLQKQG